jgi:hypothetical protein
MEIVAGVPVASMARPERPLRQAWLYRVDLSPGRVRSGLAAAVDLIEE